MSITVVGNCQALVLADLLGAMTQTRDTSGLLVSTVRAAPEKLDEALKTSGTVFIQTAHFDELTAGRGLSKEALDRLVRFPTIYFPAFHPDFVAEDDRRVSSKIGFAMPAIALYGFMNGFSAEETIGLFRGEVFEALGYTNCWPDAEAALLADGAACGIALGEDLEKWRRTMGCFLYAPNHPRLEMMGDIARRLADRAGLRCILRDPGAMIADRFKLSTVWPVYPEIADALGIAAQGSYFFRRPMTAEQKPLFGDTMFDLPQMVEGIYELNRNVDKAELRCARFANGAYAVLDDLRQTRPRRRAPNPYSKLPPAQFWRTAIAATPPEAVDPVTEVAFRIDAGTKVATAGSCFAQHVSRHLSRNGLPPFVTEPAEPGAEEEPFSARYGNIYTPRQLHQLLDRAEGRFVPADRAWRQDGGFIDPFRPRVATFATAAELEAARGEHLAQVRRLFRELDVFVFTLGLTEAWEAVADGAVFPLAPGVVGDALDLSHYAFRNFTANEVEADLLAFIDALRALNPQAKIVLTVSPVPLVATYEHRHVLVSNTYSKSALRVAAEAVCKARPAVDYFPAYEIITGSYNRGRYFEADLRSVTPEGVAHVMRSFMRHYVGAAAAAGPAAMPGQPQTASPVDFSAERRLLCDEELLDDPAP